MTAPLPWRPPEIRPTYPVVTLTARQADVLTGLHYGLTNFQIGTRLGLSEMTVKTHVKRLFVAMGARDRCHAVALATSGRVTIQIGDAA